MRQDTKTTLERRVLIAVRDMWPLVVYGLRLCGLLEKLGAAAGAEWRASGFDERLAWLPMSFRVGFEYVPLACGRRSVDLELTQRAPGSRPCGTSSLNRRRPVATRRSWCVLVFPGFSCACL